MLGGAGIDAASSAQSRWVGTGVACGSTGLDGISTRDGGAKMAAEEALDMAAAVKGTGDGETTHLGPSWGELRQVGSELGVEGGQEV